MTLSSAKSHTIKRNKLCKVRIFFSHVKDQDVQTEIVNKTVEMYLRCFVYDTPKQWVSMIPWAQFWYNTAFHHNILMCPFQAVFGREPPKIIPYVRDTKDPIALQETLAARDNLITQLRLNLTKAQEYMKNQADKKRKALEFKVGELVLVKLQPYRQHSLALRKNQKLGMRFFGPFEIMQKIGQVAYKLKLLEGTKIHPVFHISLLKKFHREPTQTYLPLPLCSSEDYPELNLEDKVAFDGEGNVTDNGKDDVAEETVMAVKEPSRRSNRMKKPNTLYKDFIISKKA